MKRNLIYILIGIITVFAVSCVEEPLAVVGDPDAENCYGVYFPAQKGAGDIQLDMDDPTMLSFTVRRTNTRGAIKVPARLIVDSLGVFSMSPIDFADGEPTTQVNIYFGSAEEAVKYDCTIQLEGDDYVSKYSTNPSFLTFSVMRLQWNPVKGPNGETSGKWRDGVFPEWFAVAEPYLEKEVVLEERDDLPGYYRIYDVYNTDYLTLMFATDATGICISQNYTYIDATDPDKVWIPTFRAGVLMSPEYGEMSIASYVVENEDFDPSITSVYGTLKDGVITFPSGSLQMRLERMGWYATNSAGKHRVILPGHRAMEYELDLSAGVSDADGILPISVDVGSDVSRVKVAVYKGSLTSTGAAAKAENIAADKDDPERQGAIRILDSSCDVSYTFDKSGMYSVVAAGIDVEGNLTVTDYVTFGYLAAGDDRKQVIITPQLYNSDRYSSEGLTAKNSMEIHIAGKGIQRLNVALYTKDNWVKNRDRLLKEMDESQLNAASLAQVNSEGGLSLKQGYLVPGKDYVLVTKAYNGYRMKIDEVYASTQGPWDPRLDQYTSADYSYDIASSPEQLCGEWHYYAMEGAMYSREYIGDVSIEMAGKQDGYDVLRVKGLFPYARKHYDMTDDSMKFLYYQGMMLNYEQYFEKFVHEGLYYYPQALLVSSDGSAYGASVGLSGGFIRDGYIAICDSGMYADMDLSFEGMVLMAYTDAQHTKYSGMIDLVMDMLLIRPDLDPDPIVSEKNDDDEDEEDEDLDLASVYDRFNGLVKKGPLNSVESFEGFMMSMVDKVMARNVGRNYFDMSKAVEIEPDFELLDSSSYTMTVTKNMR